MSIWLKFVRVRSLPACSPRGHVVSRAVSEASRSAEEVLSQEVQVHLSVRRILPFFSQPDVVSLSDRVSWLRQISRGFSSLGHGSMEPTNSCTCD